VLFQATKIILNCSRMKMGQSKYFVTRNKQKKESVIREEKQKMLSV